LKNSFEGISSTKSARKLLNVRLPQALKLLFWFLFQQPRDITPIDSLAFALRPLAITAHQDVSIFTDKTRSLV
jgi:hypothetical protein